MFHVVYSRHYWDYEGQGTFANTWTLYRNVDYSQICLMSDKCAELKEKADKDYAKYETTKDHESDPDQFYMSEVYIVDDKIILEPTKMSILMFLAILIMLKA